MIVWGKNLPQLRFGSLKRRIAVVYTALFTIVLAVVMVVVSANIERFGEQSASRDLAANARVFDEIIELRARQMRGSADVLSRDFGFREAVATSDRPTIASALRSLQSRSNTSAAFVVGLDGDLIGEEGQAYPEVESIWYQLDNGAEKGVIRLGDTLALAASSPIEAPDTIGWLVLAQPLDASEMARLADLAAVEVAARVAHAPELAGPLADAQLARVIEADDAARTLYHVTALPTLDDSVEPRLVLGHSLGTALAEYAGLKYLLALVALGGLLLVLVLGSRVARGVTGPLAKLDAAVRRFAAGEDVSLAIATQDEVGRLAASFNDMVVAIEERERKILHVGLHDGLTDLPNRKLFVEQLGQTLARLGPDERLFVAYCDLDDFKVVNDTLGHPAGDELLRQVASSLRCRSEFSHIARLGGDEFAVIIHERDPAADLVDTARLLKDCFDQDVTIDGQSAPTSASIGIAVAPGDGTDTTVLLKHADLALYRAKRDGKATFHFFEQSLDEQARRRREMELDLRLAIKDGGFELHFQPLYSLTHERLQGFEALIRWNHPTRGTISPAEFIPLAEETGLILQVGEWVVREACHIASGWPEDISVAVNISPKQFTYPGLSTTILQALTNSGLPPQRLELEITESVFIADVEHTLSTLHSLRNLGVRISLDDFGTGYSSLSYLRQFPFDKIKIDQSFVRDLAQQGNNAHAVIRAITTLADALSMETLAEGVEDEQQCRILREEGCGSIQGYLLSRPVRAHVVQEMLAPRDRRHALGAM
ncbi:putative bifunctional diguanylate cyclase/phosphodiesterase [Qipengyuania nanhaisediminis]|uniref:Diguanylate cyclase (GGDEF) domain-containing protein n=1 Tax=Qipengyuania nanhaisediminis TaxID=604088 RepID=A0A1I5QEG7_9SPHN|nr:EAL domain-containing protein [Qipengyuania nanhaisediminis]SFP44652.1 diguanylate cyclase (GGDEF) domain-containing protein [Qipengyuania nanhaisediminis]